MNETKQRTFDIAVVGAGPAGSMAALYAATGGRNVCLFERKQTVGIPVRCGEGIGLKGISASAEFDRRWVQATIRKACFMSPGGRTVTLEDIEESCILDREIMDRDLALRAESAGAVLLCGTPVLSVSRSDRALYRCTTPAGDYFASCVILAEGVESRLARSLGWDTSLALSDIESCAFCRIRHPSIQSDAVWFYVGSTYAPGGFAWVFPRAEGWANVGLGLLGSLCESGKPQQFLERFVERFFPGSSLTDLHCGGVPVGKWVKPLVRDGVMLVGDAARQVNSLSGAGIAYGMYAGRLAGQTAARAFETGTCDYRRLADYEKAWAKHLGKQQLRSYALKTMLLLKNNDAFLERIARSFEHADPSRLKYVALFLRAFARHPLLLLKAWRLFGANRAGRRTGDT